jgi:short-subunit dehydrogenase
MFSGKTALITGASSGIGEQMARQLAAVGCNLILVARRTDRLDALAGELGAVTVDVITADLADPEAPEAVFAQTQAAGRQVDILINNAGFGFQKSLLAVDQLGMVDVNVRSLLAMTQLFAVPMVQRGQGWVLNVSSVSAWFPIPGMATYAASKACVLHLSRALHEELKPAGVVVTALCPGGTRTEFSSIARDRMDPDLEKAMMPADVVAAAGLQALAKGKAVEVPGALYLMMVALVRVLPASWVTRLAGKVMGRHH